MIPQFWNVKVVSQRPTSISSVDDSDVPEVAEEEQHETPASLKEKQVAMEQQVYRIWTYVSSPPFFLLASLRPLHQRSFGL
jgi:hypothetical protein